MADAGLYARRMCDFIELKLCQCLHWRRTSPASSTDSSWSYLCPITLRLARRACMPAAYLDALVPVNRCSRLLSRNFPDAIPRWQCKGIGRRGRENGLVGRLLFMWPWPEQCTLLRRGGPYPSRIAVRRVRHLIEVLISRVTTPAPMGAFFRNEGGRNTPSLPRMEEGTQGVSLSFKEEVACGSGWFPAPG